MNWFQNVPFPVRHRLYVQSDEETREGEVGLTGFSEGGDTSAYHVVDGLLGHTGFEGRGQKRRGKHQTGWLECREGLQMTLEI